MAYGCLGTAIAIAGFAAGTHPRAAGTATTSAMTSATTTNDGLDDRRGGGLSGMLATRR